MKLNKFTALAFAAVAFGACSQMDELQPQGGTLLTSQVQETIETVPSRSNASFNGMYTKIGKPAGISSRPDDWGFVSSFFSGDIESGDIILPNSGYNWFSVCGELSSRNANYANPYNRYAIVYNTVSAANDVIKSFPADTEDQEAIYKMAQARAIRAFAYLNIAPYFQFRYVDAKDEPCVPLVTEAEVDFTQNPRATVGEVYDQIISDLTYAVDNLEGFTRADKSRIDKQVAHGLRARAYLAMGMYDEALADATAAAEGYTPASIEEVSVPSFYNLSDHNWLWGYDMTVDLAAVYIYATSSAWLRSFSGYSYSAGVQVYASINNLLYNKIPDTDVRKGWWVNEDLESPLLEHVTWAGVSGNAVATLEIDDTKMAFLPYTNVKFGMYTYGGVTNEEDWPFMRVEEMILIQAECYANLGQEGKAIEVLDNFVKNYRNPAYSAAITGRSITDEIWFQRRVELWGEGFANPDLRRLKKPMVRFHDGESNQPAAYRFNMPADDGWWLLRFPQSEMNTNFGIVDNTEGRSPVQDQYPELRDGVTD